MHMCAQCTCVQVSALVGMVLLYDVDDEWLDRTRRRMELASK